MITNDNLKRSFCADGFPTTMRQTRRIIPVSLFVVLASACAASAGRIDYPDAVTGENIAFTDIIEASGTDPLPLFGPPVATGGDTLLFTPVDFRSVSGGDTPSSDITDGQLLMTIASLGDHGVSSIEVREEGVYTVAGPADATALAMAEATLFYWITEVDGEPIKPIGSTETLGPFVASHGGGIDPIGTWSLEGNLDIAGLLGTPGSDVTEVVLSLDNTFVTTASHGGSAAIDCKGFQANSISLPEPASATLIGLGLFCLTGLRTRRK